MPLRIITCYSPPLGVEWAGAGVAVVHDLCEVERATAASGDAMADTLRLRHPRLACDAKAVFGPPREVLVDVSAHAALVVVGKTGAGAAKALFLGSVANQQGVDDRWWWTAGAVAASCLWFGALGFGGRLLRPLFARPLTWRVFDGCVAVVMLVFGVLLVVGA